MLKQIREADNLGQIDLAVSSRRDRRFDSVLNLMESEPVAKRAPLFARVCRSNYG